MLRISLRQKKYHHMKSSLSNCMKGIKQSNTVGWCDDFFKNLKKRPLLQFHILLKGKSSVRNGGKNIQTVLFFVDRMTNNLDGYLILYLNFYQNEKILWTSNFQFILVFFIYFKQNWCFNYLKMKKVTEKTKTRHKTKTPHTTLYYYWQQQKMALHHHILFGIYGSTLETCGHGGLALDWPIHGHMIMVRFRNWWLGMHGKESTRYVAYSHMTAWLLVIGWHGMGAILLSWKPEGQFCCHGNICVH